ncbi:hypothetical protein [Tardiphaga sp. 839_C3_N1_4]|uniref:hypothetical protein n=1 Tax=Tardiphaga sp. 839_C3_N1_4 TaxID=3240761 RepID=UPI003F29ADD0
MGTKLSFAFWCAALTMIGGNASAADMLVRTPLDARAWINPILIANTQVGLGVVGHRVDYNETTSQAPRFSSEKGWLPGLQLGVSAMAPIGAVTNIYFMGVFTWIAGKTEYGASGGPVTKDFSGADIRNLDLRFGKGFDVAADWMITPYLGAGYRGWERNLGNGNSPSGYRELYEHGYAGGGLLVQWAASDRIVLSASGLIGTTLAPKMTTSFNGGVPINPLTYDLGSSTMYMAGLSADYAITREWHANVGIDFLNFRYGASAVAFDGSLEPDSRTSNWTIKAGFGYSLFKPAVITANN